MKALITRRSIIIASTAVLIALISLVSLNVFNNPGPVSGAANIITMPIRSLASTVARTFGDIFASIYRYQELEMINEDLRRQVFEMRADYSDSVALAEENRLLRDLLHFRERHAGFAHVQVQLQSWNSDNWSHSFIISTGYSDSDIAVGMPVATEYGILIGQVSEVRASESTVITVLDTTFSAGAFIGGDNENEAEGGATAKGDFTHMRNGLLILDHIDDDLSILPGTDIFTSGTGGRFPRGLLIGEIIEVRNHSSGIGRYAIIRPSRDINTIQSMVVILGINEAEFRPEQPSEQPSEQPVEQPLDLPSERPLLEFDDQTE